MGGADAQLSRRPMVVSWDKSERWVESVQCAAQKATTSTAQCMASGRTCVARHKMQADDRKVQMKQAVLDTA